MVSVGSEQWKKAVEKSLAAERIGQNRWQTRPVPSQDVFSDRVGYGKGCPWTCPFGRGDIDYTKESYPLTEQFIASYAYLGGVYPPNTMELMKLYIDGFRKVSEDAETVVEPGQ